MAARLQSTFKSDKGVLYLVTIYDNDYVGATTEFNATELIVQYNSEDNDDPFAAMLTSDLRISILINNSTLDTFVDDFIDAAEDRFYIIVTAGSFDFAWIGAILSDLVSKEDLPLSIGYLFEIRAKDGLNTLKTTDYKDGSIPYDGSLKETFVKHLMNCLLKVPFIPVHYTVLAPLYIVANWHNAAWTYAANVNPLLKTRSAHKAFYYKDNSGNYVYQNSFSIIKQICEAWGARIVASGFGFYVQQINSFADAASLTIFSYTTAMAQTVASSQDITVDHTQTDPGTDMIRFSGGKFEYLGALKKVTIDYEHIIIRNLIPGVIFAHDMPDSAVINDVGTTDDFPAFYLTFKLTWTAVYDGVSFQPFALKFRIEFNTSSGYYLIRDLTWNGSWFTLEPIEWDTNPGYYYFFAPPDGIIRFPSESGYRSFEILTPTVAIGEQADITYRIVYDSAIFADGTTVPPEDVTVTWKAEENLMQFLFDGSFSSKNDIYRFVNTNNRVVSSTKSLKTKHGDGPTITAPGHLEVENNAATWVVTEGGWTVAGAGTPKEFSRLLANQIIQTRITPVEHFANMSFQMLQPGTNRFQPHKAILYNGEKYIFQYGTYNIKTEIWSGRWFKLQSGSDYTEVGRELILRDSNDGPPSTGGTGGSGSGGSSGGGSGGGSPISPTPYHQRFENHASATLTVTANGGLIPINENKYKIFIGGQLVSPVYFSISGSNITLTFTPSNENIDVFFDYP